ncbi:formylglycine-generating enzyme family protein [Pseudoalteromonas sp. C2R02]|uniref:formylglycine-generating enzyme family protein n=1 Tax=Pseudoalteromonas sp. C2R02 TaxID=2841565 RepID=UPI001C09D305|nr:formylglycine-generating enzyme family protein [Pseudoalteromonas sp. C2R02]MBU2969659.1 formylglycine-generating enzyme family protein [Pseudoalteromonas sp. C2R02]
MRFLYAKIIDILTHKGEISGGDKQELNTLAHVAGLDETALMCFISEIELSIREQLIPLKNWLASLEKHISVIETDNKLKKALIESGKEIGLTQLQITDFFKDKLQELKSNPTKPNEQKTSRNNSENIQKYLKSIIQVCQAYKNKIIIIITLIALTFTAISWIEHFQLEENAWEKAKETNDIDSYERFSQSFSNGEYDELAQSRADEIIHDKWTAAKVENSEFVYKNYIEKNPQSPYLKQAKDNLNQLITDKKAKFNQEDDTVWQQAKLTNTEAAYKNYLLKIKQGKYVKQAQDKLSNLILTRKNKAIESDTKAWELASKNDTEQSYRDYLQNQVQGEYIAQASEKMAKLENKRTFLHSFDVQFITIPSGDFMMGVKNISSYEVPVHKVKVATFKLMATEVTFALWQACYQDKACLHKPKGFINSKNKPVVNISWNEITKQFIPWFNKKTGRKYRLPSEAEWEYAARAGSYDKYTWGDRINCSQARFGYYSNQCEKQKYPDDVKTYPKNSFGLYDMHGNVKELVQDCWNDNFKNAPNDGSAWLTGRCRKAVLKDGSYKSKQSQLRLGVRYRHDKNARFDDDGFRLAQDL